MFQDLLNFDDPLNLEAAEHYQRDKVRIVYIQYYISIICSLYIHSCSGVALH